MPADEGRVTVLFIAGYMRIGSTLLERMLAEAPGVVSVGELRHLWVNSFGHDHRCGCGRPFRACPFWAGVMDVAFGGVDRVAVSRMIRLQRTTDRMWFIPWMRTRLRPAAYGARLTEYGRILGDVYRSVATVSGAGVVVDSTKSASQAWLLSTVPGIDLRVVHLVRDARAVAHSWSRLKPKPEVWGRAAMPRYPPARAAFEWNAMNAGADLLGGLDMPFVRVRYEDLADAPAATLDRIAGALDLPSASAAVEGRSVRLGVHHTLSGNPVRFDTGPVAVVPDLEWEVAMPGRNRRLVTALTWPLQVRYGYQLGRPRPGRGTPRDESDEEPRAASAPSGDRPGQGETSP